VQHEKDFIQERRPELPTAAVSQFPDSKPYGSIRADGPGSLDEAVTDPTPALRQGAGPMPRATVEGKQAMADSAKISP